LINSILAVFVYRDSELVCLNCLVTYTETIMSN
jgi:hypothetical protein